MYRAILRSNVLIIDDKSMLNVTLSIIRIIIYIAQRPFMLF